MAKKLKTVFFTHRRGGRLLGRTIAFPNKKSAGGGGGVPEPPVITTGMRRVSKSRDGAFLRPATNALAVEPAKNWWWAGWCFAVNAEFNTITTTAEMAQNETLWRQWKSGNKGVILRITSGFFQFQIADGTDSTLGQSETTGTIFTNRHYFVFAYLDTSEGANGTIHLIVRDLLGNRLTDSDPLSSAVPDIANESIGVGMRSTGSQKFEGLLGKIGVGKPSDMAAVASGIETSLWNEGRGKSFDELTAQERTDWGLVAFYDATENAGEPLRDSVGSLDFTDESGSNDGQLFGPFESTETELFTGTGSLDWWGRPRLATTDARWVLFHTEAEEHGGNPGDRQRFYCSVDEGATWRTPNTLDGSTVIGPLESVSTPALTEVITRGFPDGDIVILGRSNDRWVIPAGQDVINHTGTVTYEGPSGAMPNGGSIGNNFQHSVGSDGAWYISVFDGDLANEPVYVNKSTDKGVTWSFAGQIHEGRDEWLSREGALAHMGGGHWLAIARGAGNPGYGSALYRSTDEAATWQPVELAGSLHRISFMRSFDAASNESMSMPSEPSVQFGDNDFFIAARVRLDNKDATGRVVALYRTSTSDRSFFITYSQSVDRFRFVVSSDGVNTTVLTADTLGSPEIGTTYTLLAWYDKAAGTINLRVDDLAADSAAHTGGAFATSAPDFQVGRDDNGNFLTGGVGEIVTGKPPTPIAGLIDDVHNWYFNNHAINVQPWNVPVWGLTNLWPIDEAASADAVNYALGGTDLTNNASSFGPRSTRVFGKGIGALQTGEMFYTNGRLFFIGRYRLASEWMVNAITYTDDPTADVPTWAFPITLSGADPNVNNDAGYMTGTAMNDNSLRLYGYNGTTQVSSIFQYDVPGIVPGA